MLWDEPKIFFLERRYFFSIILSEFLKNRVALQLDTCIICAFREDAVKDLLHVPASARVVSMVALGYGADNSPRKTKKNMEEIVSYDRF